MGLAGIAVMMAVVAFSTPAGAITWGYPDHGHTYGGAIIVRWSGGWYQYCSGSLVSPKVFLTAGHCTTDFSTGGIQLADVRVTFSRDIWAADAVWLEVSEAYTHPDYGGSWSDPHDIGVLVLKERVADVAPGTLPSEGLLDELYAKGLLKDATFINVGYGADQSMPPNRKSMPGPDARWYSTSGFRSLHNAWLYMSGNVHLGYGGTCYGDSGGPTLYRDMAGVETIVALTVWGDAPCKSTNNNYRVDTGESLAFVLDMIGRNG
jgi:secreted trypsin-like serine protease